MSDLSKTHFLMANQETHRIRFEMDKLKAINADLLEALKNAIDYLDGPMGEITNYKGDQHIIQPMRDAIAKATGKGK